MRDTICLPFPLSPSLQSAVHSEGAGSKPSTHKADKTSESEMIILYMVTMVTQIQD